MPGRRRTRAPDLADFGRITAALAKLLEAASLLHDAEAYAASAYVRRAIKSADGARRHAARLLGGGAWLRTLTELGGFEQATARDGVILVERGARPRGPAPVPETEEQP